MLSLVSKGLRPHRRKYLLVDRPGVDCTLEQATFSAWLHLSTFPVAWCWTTSMYWASQTGHCHAGQAHFGQSTFSISSSRRWWRQNFSMVLGPGGLRLWSRCKHCEPSSSTPLRRFCAWTQRSILPMPRFWNWQAQWKTCTAQEHMMADVHGLSAQFFSSPAFQRCWIWPKPWTCTWSGAWRCSFEWEAFHHCAGLGFASCTCPPAICAWAQVGLRCYMSELFAIPLVEHTFAATSCSHSPWRWRE